MINRRDSLLEHMGLIVDEQLACQKVIACITPVFKHQHIQRQLMKRRRAHGTANLNNREEVLMGTNP